MDAELVSEMDLAFELHPVKSFSLLKWAARPSVKGRMKEVLTYFEVFRNVINRGLSCLIYT